MNITNEQLVSNIITFHKTYLVSLSLETARELSLKLLENGFRCQTRTKMCRRNEIIHPDNSIFGETRRK